MGLRLELEGRGVGAGDYFNEGDETKLASFLRMIVLMGYFRAREGGFCFGFLVFFFKSAFYQLYSCSMM